MSDEINDIDDDNPSDDEKSAGNEKFRAEGAFKLTFFLLKWLVDIMDKAHDRILKSLKLLFSLHSNNVSGYMVRS